MALCGGFRDVRDATAEDQEVLDAVKAEVESRLGTSFSHFQALKVTTQVVAGVNYLIKVKTNANVFHVKIAKPLPHTGQAPFVLALKHEDVNEDSPLELIE